MNRLFETEAGYFTPDGSEFVITTPRTPRPWANVVSNGDTGFIVSQAGGGYSWRSNAQVNRITRWEQDVIKDEWGKFLYLQDLDTGAIWSAAWKPVCQEPDHYEVRYGAGYATFVSRLFGIESTWTMFIPVDDPVEVWKLTVRNRSRRRRRIRLMTYMEWCLGSAPDWHREFHKCFIETSYDRSRNALVATKRLWEVPSEHGHWNSNWPYVAFHSCSAKPVSYDCSKENVLGLYGTVQNPRGLRLKHLPKETGNLRDPVASLEIELLLKPGEERVVSFTLGAAKSREEMKALTVRYHSISAVDKALRQVKGRWNELLGATSVETPDPALDILLNRWLAYQAIAGRLWGRNGYYQAGGAFGYRDQLQDSQIFLPIAPQFTRDQILLHARHQFKDGTVYHWWHPLSEVGLTTTMTDDLLWLPFVVHSYIEETGDIGLLDHKEPFVDDKTSASIYDHCVRAIERVLVRFSPRGLPLLGAGDWNDGVNAAGIAWKGESVWLGQFLHAILRSFSGIAAEHGDMARHKEFNNRADALRAAVNEHGWDGEWYFYATRDDGQKIGSRENAAGRIHLNPQTWAVIADVADADRARAVMDQVKDQLEFKAGPVLLHPAYDVPDEKIGYLTRYAPGTRENGAVYTHAATWAVIASAKLGRAEDAYRIFRKLSPIERGKNLREYCAEPFVTAGNIDGPESPFYGRGGWTWYSGSAAWLWKAGFEWILGVRASRAGLIVEPCIPRRWKAYTVRRTFRGATYHIAVKNPEGKDRGIQSVMIDGKPMERFIAGTSVTLPEFPKGTSHSITIIMGGPSDVRR